MDILYYSAHTVLEDDELRLFKALGHSVCILGTRTTGGALSFPYRPEVPITDAERKFYEIYERLGGQYQAPADSPDFIPEGFAEHFDVLIVMHQFHIIQSNWLKMRLLRKKAVIWRTIGQDMVDFERYLRPFRDDGLKIVRYSPVELEVPNTLGSDSVIRFCKDPDQYRGWHGSSGKVLSFVNSFRYRYPEEADDFVRLSEIVPSELGGASNNEFSNWLGFMSLEQQIECYQRCGVYLYLAGLAIPYTLNFVEAWMTGAPVVVYAPTERKGEFFEIDRLVSSGVDGFVCATLEDTISICTALIADKETARRVGAAGRIKSIELFSNGIIQIQWKKLFDEIHK